MSKQSYDLYLNVVASICDISGRSLGRLKNSLSLVRIFQILMLLSNMFLIFSYLTNLYFDYESLSYIFFALCAIILTGSGISSTSYLKQVSIHSSSKLHMSISSLMVTSLMSGIAVGNLISHLFPFLKKHVFHNDRH